MISKKQTIHKSLISVLAIALSYNLTPAIANAEDLSPPTNLSSMNPQDVLEQLNYTLSKSGIDGFNISEISENDNTENVALSEHRDSSDHTSSTIHISDNSGSEIKLSIDNTETLQKLSNTSTLIDNKAEGIKHIVQDLPGEASRIISIADNSYSSQAIH